MSEGKQYEQQQASQWTDLMGQAFRQAYWKGGSDFIRIQKF